MTQSPTPTVTVRRLGIVDCADSYAAMRAHVASRDSSQDDEIWLLQHPPVYTCGLSTQPEQVPQAATLPVLRLDRGGQVTYHGPGQWIAYVLLDLRRRELGVRTLVRSLEQSVIDLTEYFGGRAFRRDRAPGVYLPSGKIASVGLRVTHGLTYHGISLNVDVDLAPFGAIAVCGELGLPVARLRDLGLRIPGGELAEQWIGHILHRLEHPPEQTP